MRGRDSRFWLIYAGAWLPVVLVYVVILLIQGSSPGVEMLLTALANVVPAAILGTGAVVATHLIPWPPASWPRFLMVHLALSWLYAGLWYLGVAVALGVRDVALGRPWALGFLADAAVPWLLFQGVILYALIAGVTYTARVTRALRLQQVRAARAESRAARAEAVRTAAELHALRARLNPHFLFNTLNSLNALVRRDGDEASEALDHLAAMFRYTLGVDAGADEEVALRAELAFIEDYLALEKLRLGDRLNVEVVVPPEALDVKIPAFTLQPLVENAVRHGLAGRAGGGRLRIEAAVMGSKLLLRVSDDGPGGDPTAPGGGSGLGLRLVRQRLATRFGDAASLDVDTAPASGFTVVVTLPAAPSDAPVPA